MYKIAIVCPWPPQESGISDYSVELARACCNARFDVHVFTTVQNPAPIAGITFYHVYRVEEAIAALDDFPSILIQMGNHPYFHGYMLRIIEAHASKCTVELHDLMLHHLMLGHSGARDESNYLSWIKSQYGRIVSAEFDHDVRAGVDLLNRNVILDYPCSDAILFFCRNIIVHSEFAATKLRRRRERVYVVPLTYPDKKRRTREIDRDENSPLKIGVFGTVQRNRRLDWLISALVRVQSQGVAWHLQVSGRVDDDCAYIVDHVKSLGLSKSIEFFGRVDEETLAENFSACDLHVALRSPTMGETSAVVTKGLQLGITTIVSDAGWYSELPDCVLKVSDGDAVERLSDIIIELSSDLSRINVLGERSAQYSHLYLNMNLAVDDILGVCVAS